MSVIIIPRRHRREPQGRVEIDWSSDLASAARIVSVTAPQVGTVTRDRQAHMIALSNGVVGGTPQGLAYRSFGANDGHMSEGPFDVISGASELSGYVLGSSGGGAIFGRWARLDGAISGSGFLVTQTGGSIGVVVSGQEGQTSLWSGRTATVSLTDLRFGWTWAGANNTQIYASGAASAQVAWFAGNPSAIPSVSANLYVNRHASAGSGAAGTQVAISILALSSWSDVIHREVDAAPYQIFRADPIRIYSLPSGPISISWSSLTASNITQTGARLTLGGIVR